MSVADVPLITISLLLLIPFAVAQCVYPSIYLPPTCCYARFLCPSVSLSVRLSVRLSLCPSFSPLYPCAVYVYLLSLYPPTFCLFLFLMYRYLSSSLCICSFGNHTALFLTQAFSKTSQSTQAREPDVQKLFTTLCTKLKAEESAIDRELKKEGRDLDAEENVPGTA